MGRGFQVWKLQLKISLWEEKLYLRWANFWKSYIPKITVIKKGCPKPIFSSEKNGMIFEIEPLKPDLGTF